MKRNITKLLAGIVIICMLVTAMLPVEAGAASAAAVSASTATAECGSSVDVVISLASNPGIWSLGLSVGYDHSALTLTGWTAGDIFASGEVTPPPSLDKATYFFLACRDGLTDTTENGTLVTLTFLVAANAAFDDYPIALELSSKNTINVSDEIVNFDMTNGTITVVPETAAITFNTAGGSAVTAFSGYVGSPVETPANPTKAGFAFTGWLPAIPAVIPEGGLTVTAQWVVLGDINNDDKRTSIDALMVLHAASGKLTLTGIQMLAADVSKNGTVSPLDALMILQFVAGKITSL